MPMFCRKRQVKADEDVKMKYTAKYFLDTMPEWKRKKDPILSRLVYRRAGYALAALFANRGIGANAVSFFSIIEGIAACLLFLPRSYLCHIAGAVLVNFWLVLDCTDGCIARGVKAEPFGEFADGISSYIIVALLGSCMGITVFFEGGVFIAAGSPWIILAGALASTADTLMRLIYQKYRSTEQDMTEKGIVEIEQDIRTDHEKIGSLRVKIEQDLGIGGILPAMVLVGTVFRALDLVLCYCFLYYVGSCLAVTAMYVRKAVKAGKQTTG